MPYRTRRVGSTSEVYMQLPLAFDVDVLEAHLAAGDQLVVLRAADLDLPELLRASLLDRHRDDLQRPGAMGTQEVRGVGDAHGLLVAIL